MLDHRDMLQYGQETTQLSGDILKPVSQCVCHLVLLEWLSVVLILVVSLAILMVNYLSDGTRLQLSSHSSDLMLILTPKDVNPGFTVMEKCH